MLGKYVQKKEKENPAEIKTTTPTEEIIRGSDKHVGAHLSIQGGIELIFGRIKSLGARAAAMFLKPQRTFTVKPYAPETICAFKRENTQEMLLPHASYLINLAQPDAEKAKKSYGLFLDELTRCDQLEIPLCNIHPGSNVAKLPIKAACQLISENINRAHKETKSVTVVIENMAGQGNTVGSKFKELRMIIDGVENKERIGVCLDTCHLFGAGYDIRTKKSFQKVMDEFNEVVGLEYLKGVHINDSKEALGSKKDRHASIGKGLIGLEAFVYIMNSPLFNGIPMILETPDPEKYKEEITLLYSLIEGK
ncbi:uncharacterized protein NEMAJ01_1067 [Nematocida major]|uniref:uncharacterized protein n=1 Tax=Nematocida major TaxID=1912982 RepID=UPI002008C6AB|nr:uncharacterized protein NEMAJ01_1067 [Nematocida major]KAH9386171.1 hypothetical protein NEMAJ01_1067 [Nematocida major]